MDIGSVGSLGEKITLRGNIKDFPVAGGTVGGIDTIGFVVGYEELYLGVQYL